MMQFVSFHASLLETRLLSHSYSSVVHYPEDMQAHV